MSDWTARSVWPRADLMPGPLRGVRIVEIASIGPGPFACMMLADHGADVIRVERTGTSVPPELDVLTRSRDALAVDLKSAEGVQIVRDLARTADGLVEGFRPGVMERLGLGPDILLADNPRLVYGRMTGWGQFGPNAAAAGHDINYIALAGALHGMGRAGEKPTPPINLVGDICGGAMMLAFGMVSAILHARLGGEGQVIDCAMTDGSALSMAMIRGLWSSGQWHDERGVNLIDTGAPFYDSYRTADGHYVALGSLEPQFYALLREKLGLREDPNFEYQMDEPTWPGQRRTLDALFESRTRDEWCALLEGTDACFAPILSMAEAPAHPHNIARKTFVEVNGAVQPAPAPRYSRTVPDTPRPLGRTTDAILGRLGYSDDRIARLRATAIVR